MTETPQYLRATSFASMDTPGPFETKATEAYYYVTPVESNWPPEQKEEWLTAFNYYTTDIVSIHEAYPGHYIQFLHLNASSATPVEKIFSGYAFIEGWAHYCEQMVVDEGFGADSSAAPGSPDALKAAKYRLAQTDEALLRICRLCVSIKMHCQGMTVDEATHFFQDNCYYEVKPAHSEAMRGTFDPEYLYYTLGKLEILNLREDYRKQEGAEFLPAKIPRRTAPPRRAAHPSAARNDAQGPRHLGSGSLIESYRTRRGNRQRSIFGGRIPTPMPSPAGSGTRVARERRVGLLGKEAPGRRLPVSHRRQRAKTQELMG